MAQSLLQLHSGGLGRGQPPLQQSLPQQFQQQLPGFGGGGGAPPGSGNTLLSLLQGRGAIGAGAIGAGGAPPPSMSQPQVPDLHPILLPSVNDSRATTPRIMRA